MATSADVLIATRAFMGIGGAMIMPSTLSILGTVFPDPAERANAIAIWAAMSAVGIAAGPVLGGLLLAHFSWGSIFMVNVPVVVVALIGGHFLVPTSRDPAPGRMDPLGSLLSIATLVGLVFAVIEGPDKGLDERAHRGRRGGVGAVGHRRLRRLGAHSTIPCSIWRCSVTAASAWGPSRSPCCYFGALGTYFLYTQHLQFVLGYSPLRAGVYSVPFGVVLVAFVPADAPG